MFKSRPVVECSRFLMQWNTVRPWKPNIHIQNPSKIWTFLFRWLGIKMIGTIATTIAKVPSVPKQNQYIEIQDGANWSDLEWLGCLVLECPSESEPSNIQTTFEHSKSEHVRLSRPHCTNLQNVQFLYVAGFWMIGFWIPTALLENNCDRL